MGENLKSVKIPGFQTLPKVQHQKKRVIIFFFKKTQEPQKVTHLTHSPGHRSYNTTSLYCTAI